MKFNSTILLDNTQRNTTITYYDQLPDVVEVIIKLNSRSFEGILNACKIHVNILYHIPGKGINTKRLILDSQDLKRSHWSAVFYLGEFIRQIKISADLNCPPVELELNIQEFKPEDQTTITEEKLLNYILTDNWLRLSENLRSLSSTVLQKLLANHLNHIQEINRSSTELIEYLLAKQIISFWGNGSIAIDQVDLAAEAYDYGYNMITINNEKIIHNYGQR